MSWVKRNLYFLVLCAVAAVLLGLAGYYIHSKWQSNQQMQTELEAAYDELESLARKKPNAGNEQINNIEVARQQEKAIRDIINSERKFFQSIEPIPVASGKFVSKEEFASALRRTLDELQRGAEAASVTVPENYGFTFEAVRSLAVFQGSLEPLSLKLGEIKAICDVLYAAKVNSLDNLRRPRVSPDDQRGPAADYLVGSSVTNRPLAVITPFELSFHCFSTELAQVLAGFANSPHCFIVKGLNIEPGGTASSAGEGPVPGSPWGVPAPTLAPAPSTTRGGPPVMVDEKQLKVTLVLNLITLLPKK